METARWTFGDQRKFFIRRCCCSVNICSSEANKVQGTAGTSYSPRISTSQKLTTWVDAVLRYVLCTPAMVEADHCIFQKCWFGVLPKDKFEGHKIVSICYSRISVTKCEPSLFDNQCYADGFKASIVPENAAYYSFGRMGLLNITSQSEGAPIFISKPHFLVHVTLYDCYCCWLFACLLFCFFFWEVFTRIFRMLIPGI